MTRYFAHSNDGPPEGWQPLRRHLNEVSRKAAEFAADFGARDWGAVAGLFHDLGKYSEAFQRYLRGGDEACAESLPRKVNHSTAGAQYAVERWPVVGLAIAYAIAGHHAGLPDAHAEGSCLDRRLKKDRIEPWRHGLAELPELPPLPQTLPLPRDPFAVAFFVRMLFSCLTDADFLDTEAFLQEEQGERRREFPSLGNLHDRFFQALETYDSNLRINATRAEIRRQCEEKAEEPPGFFSLTVPTGGGKTLSSLAFALKHARKHGLRRVIYVAPFTSIIEQTAAVFRQRLGADAVIEHHCNVDPEKESQAARLAAENWDAPLIVTTSVQFYESLFSNRPSTCRKLHNIARSVIILDEAQTLPVEYLNPCLAALKELVARYGCTIVLCTATQPAIGKRDEFTIGIEGVREIMADPTALYRQLKRVRVVDRGKLTDEALADELHSRHQALCIVNTVGHARQLFERLGREVSHFHLSARMCPAHRSQTLTAIRERLEHNERCLVVSTQVVEAGVDLDFPVVYRALAGLDSIAQTAGRCNRNNRLPEGGEVFVFSSEHQRAEAFFRDTAQCAAQVMELYPDLLGLEANTQFFRLYYWQRQSEWDKKRVLECFRFSTDLRLPFDFAFARAAREFHLIDDEATCSVIVPWGKQGEELVRSLRAVETPPRELLRALQRFMVQVHRREWDRHVPHDIRPIFENLGILESMTTHYDPHTGLNL